MNSNPTLEFNYGKASLLLLIPTIGLIAVGYGLQRFIDSTPGGGSGEFQGINHFAPALMLMLVCIPGTLIASMAGMGAGLIHAVKSKPRNRYVIAATVIHGVVCIGWLIRFLQPLADIFLR